MCCYCHSCISHRTTPNSFAFPLALKQNEALEKAFSQFYDPLSGNPPFCDYLFDLDSPPSPLLAMPLTAFLRFYAFKQSTFMPLVFYSPPPPPLCVSGTLLRSSECEKEGGGGRKMRFFKEDFVGKEFFPTLSHFLGS